MSGGNRQTQRYAGRCAVLHVLDGILQHRGVDDFETIRLRPSSTPSVGLIIEAVPMSKALRQDRSRYNNISFSQLSTVTVSCKIARRARQCSRRRPALASSKCVEGQLNRSPISLKAFSRGLKRDRDTNFTIGSYHWETLRRSARARNWGGEGAICRAMSTQVSTQHLASILSAPLWGVLQVSPRPPMEMHGSAGSVCFSFLLPLVSYRQKKQNQIKPLSFRTEKGERTYRRIVDRLFCFLFFFCHELSVLMIESDAPPHRDN
ncbi:hypothetical protein BC826DRAFT_81374 [Russula brevipes]|nr:hypothetical protein BC826DRAFT_81374 [Russula brevipes]